MPGYLRCHPGLRCGGGNGGGSRPGCVKLYHHLRAGEQGSIYVLHRAQAFLFLFSCRPPLPPCAAHSSFLRVLNEPFFLLDTLFLPYTSLRMEFRCTVSAFRGYTHPMSVIVPAVAALVRPFAATNIYSVLGLARYKRRSFPRFFLKTSSFFPLSLPPFARLSPVFSRKIVKYNDCVQDSYFFPICLFFSRDVKMFI